MDTLNQKIDTIEDEIKTIIDRIVTEKFWIIRYGATDIDPEHLVYWICVKSDAEKSMLENNQDLLSELRGLLSKHNYPPEAIENVCIGFESEETVNRDSNGNWYRHWK